MQMTLREVLQVSVLKDATVVAGTSGLDNIVDSVTTIEVTEDSMVNWVYEKQLYISAMYSVKDDVERTDKLVSIFANSNYYFYFYELKVIYNTTMGLQNQLLLNLYKDKASI